MPPSLSSQSMAEAIRSVLDDALASDPSVVVLGESVGRMGGVAGSTAGLAKAHPDRVRDLPIADRGTVGLAVGMALGGQRPVVCLSGAARLPAVLAPLVDAGAMAHRGEFGVPLVVRVPFGEEAPGWDTPVASTLVGATGIKMVCPADTAQASGLLRWALKQSTPVVILEPRTALMQRGRPSAQAIPPQARVLREGAHITLAAWGPGVRAALHAADRLASDGISAGVIDLVSLAPLDATTLGAAVRNSGRLVAIHPHATMPTVWTNQIQQAGLDEAFLYLEAPMGTAPAQADQVIGAARTAVNY